MNIYKNVTKQFNKAADLMGLDPEIRKIMPHTTNEIQVNFPVVMDDGYIRPNNATVRTKSQCSRSDRQAR